MTSPQVFLIAGGTGRQGGAVVQALLAEQYKSILPEVIFVLTRDINRPAARRLADRGVRLVQGDLAQPVSNFEYLKSIDVDLNRTAIFLAQAHGPTELNDAKLFIDARVSFAIPYLVYSSVDRGGKELSDRDASYCKTFSDKFQVEKYLQAAAVEDSKLQYTILRPTWFVDNAIWGFPGRICMTGWRDIMGGKRMQVVTTNDIGRWAVEAFLRPDKSKLRNTCIGIASDELTFQEMDEIFRQETGRPIDVTYGWLARSLIWAAKDLQTMFAWINERPYGADLAQLRQRLPPTTFRQWVVENAQTKSES